MYKLSFDTTAAACSIILQKDGRTLEKFSEAAAFGQSEILLPQIKKMLENHNLKMQDIQILGVCAGPGSFTGVRASLAAAKAFGIACPGLTLCGVSAFDAYAMSLWGDEIAECNAVLIETKREDFYIQLFDSGLKKSSAPMALYKEDIMPLLRGQKVSLVGDGVERFLAEPGNLSLHAVKMLPYLPVENVAQVAACQYQNKKPDYPKPIYLRSPDVCLKKPV